MAPSVTRFHRASPASSHGVSLIDITEATLSRAESFDIVKLGSLDAIPLSAADSLMPDLDILVTYDRELAAAA